MNKKKILIASYNLGYGGIETSLVNLLKSMNLNKYEITLILEKKEGIFLNDISKDIKIKEYSVSYNKNLLIRKLINLLKRVKWLLFNYHKYDSSICYATYSGPCGFLARTASKNKIMFVHSNYLNVYKKDINKIKQFFYKRKIFDYNKIIFVSNEAKSDLIKILPSIEKKSYVINNIVDYKKILKLSNEKIEIPEDKKNVLFVGRLEEDSKRISRIIKLAEKMKYKKDILFWIIGDGRDKEKYTELIKIKKLRNIKLIGAKKNPYPYIKKCDVLILTSDYEGFPVVYNEAFDLICIYLYNSDYWKKNNFCFCEGRYHEDFGLIPLVILKCNSAISLNYSGYFYVQTDDSITRTDDVKKNLKKAYGYLFHYDFLYNNVNNSNAFNNKTKNLFNSYISNAVILKLRTIPRKKRKKYLKEIKKRNLIDNLKSDTIIRKIKKIMLKLCPNIYLKVIR